MIKILFYTMLILVFAVIIGSLIVIQARSDPNQNSRIAVLGNQIIGFFTKNKKTLNSVKSIVLTVVMIGSIAVLVYFYFLGLPTNSKAEKYVDDYIQNSTDIEISYIEPVEMRTMRGSNQAPTPESIEKDMDIIGKYHHSHTIYTGIKFFGNRAKMKSVEFNTIIFQDEESRKYYQIMYAARTNSQMFSISAILNDGAQLIVKINKSDLQNSIYGTIENPMPILMFSVPKYEGREDYEEDKITEEQYKYNVYYYLAYIMPKEEFNERFNKPLSP